MNSKDPSSQVPQISHFTYVFLLWIQWKLRLTQILSFSCKLL
jgi:hypothetical protein